MTTPRVAVVGFAANRPLSPRGERTNMLAAELARVADVEMITGAGGDVGPAQEPSRVRRLVGDLARTVLLDRYELESARVLRRWPATVDAALLIGYPFSPLAWAAQRLAREGVPYVVDIGDPWVLTAMKSPFPTPALLRARRSERFLWEHAAGGMLTTELQAEPLRKRFPKLPVLVRPNGFAAVGDAPTPKARAHNPGTELRIVHYGNLYAPRRDLRAFLSAMATSRRWKSIRFTLYGSDWDGTLARVDQGLVVDVRQPRPWQEIIATAGEHDVALVVGNRNPAQLPSKAVQYLTLPIARAALVSDDGRDALQAYVADKPGWLTISERADPADLARTLAAHVAGSWTSSDLAAPESESWPAVSARILKFVSACTSLPLIPCAVSI